MFGSLVRAFRQAVVNFRTELQRGEPAELTDPGLRALAREIAGVAARVVALEAEQRAVALEAEREAREADVCARRFEMARGIGDGETARVAAEFRNRHRRRRDLFVEKGELLEREVAERKRDLDEMRAGLGKAVQG